MKVAICGAGITGLALAHRLAARDVEVVVLERAAGPRAQGYMIDFFGPGFDAVEEMGLLPQVEDAAYRVDEATLLDDRGRPRAAIDYVRFAKSVRGRLCSIMRPDLEHVLRTGLPSTVDVRFGAGVAGVEDLGDRVRITLTDGEVLEADLLVGADGIHSTVRRLVFGDEDRFLRYLGFHTAAFVFEDEKIREEVGDRFCLTDTIGMQMGFYGLRDGKLAAFAVHRAADPALPEDARGTLRATYGSLGWAVPKALERCPPSGEVYYDQVAQIEMPSWSRGRVVLVGDSCYAVSLLAGQGASLGIAGAFVLADRLTRAPSIDAAFAEYEKLVRPVVTEKQQVARRGARWFLPANRFLLQARRVLLRVARLPGLERPLAAAVTGKSTALVTNLRRGAEIRSGS
ncbi:FAD-dependent oxidoreductase [Amycolatopsis regifaucium]|uniref:FAD-dependent oxidoreductase n=1 Tax=Amycolatopsis regifaucium TaxID=546365 RepID=A0A154MRJ8_9PSEU|nr:FAD-dependent oxidoreductase [Amycolatopsis regifaucium]KZB86951.1 FAD-dependent oxidoreductase [Amycolatopsis regifaucium]OKA09381.1 FAD-dependent oxidoreductase [Amycolatopsis regifaucium]SFH59777.1 2-polyprenyl-6-methoxyphenol hydroxylase [Amycolatopsis regifaucium]